MKLKTRSKRLTNCLKFSLIITLLFLYSCTTNEESIEDITLQNEATNSLLVFGEVEDRTYKLIPTLIEAERYAYKNGPEVETTTDEGGGENMGHIAVDDRLAYYIRIPYTGSYDINFRVASRRRDIKFDIYVNSVLLTSVEAPATGGWQTWETVTATVELTEGERIFTIVATEKEWNINWIEFIGEEVVLEEIPLNLRVHLMQTDPWIHPLGVEMESWVTPEDVEETIIPELNNLWSEANITWEIESIIEEPINEFEGYLDSIDYVVNSSRDAFGSSDPDRLPHLYNLMQPYYRSAQDELDENLFHIYLFPFIGNTSQGSAMSSYDYHSVVGTWTNKFNSGGIPEKTYLTEDQEAFVRGSLTRTIAHELGHVLGLTHNECSDCLMYYNGYGLSYDQILTSRAVAEERL